DHAERPHREVLHLVRRHRLRDDLDRTREALLLRKFLRAEDRRAGAVGRGTTLEDRERVVDHARGEHLLERAGLLVLGARVVHRVAVVLDAHLGELLLRRAVLLHVLAAAVAEHDGRDGRLLVDVGRGADRLLQARELLLERALLHLLEAEGEHALVHARRDRLVPEVEGRRPGRAVVVDVVDGEPADAHRVERALSLRAHAVHVAGEGLLELLGCDTRHLEGAIHRLAHEVGEVTRAALELRHADTDHAHVSLGHAVSSVERAPYRRPPRMRKGSSGVRRAESGIPRGLLPLSVARRTTRTPRLSSRHGTTARPPRAETRRTRGARAARAAAPSSAAAVRSARSPTTRRPTREAPAAPKEHLSLEVPDRLFARGSGYRNDPRDGNVALRYEDLLARLDAPEIAAELRLQLRDGRDVHVVTIVKSS